MNEIKISAGGVTYRLTDTNNGNKYSRAKTEAGEGASIEKILAYYDKFEGSIHDKNHEKVENGRFWAAEKARMQDERNQLKSKSEEELEDIVRRGENMDIPGSLFQLAKLELELRDRKNRNDQGPKIGILNTGKHNTFIDNTFTNLDVVIQDEGEGTMAKGNKFFSLEDANLTNNRNMPFASSGHPPAPKKQWYEKPFGIIVLGVVVVLIGAYIVHLLGWA